MTVQVDVKFEEWGREPSILREAAHAFSVALNILSGRVTRNGAQFRLEVSGAAENVEGMIRRFHEQHGRVRARNMKG